MRKVLLVVAVVVILGLSSAPAGGQHSHGSGPPGLVVLHDVADDGATFVNNTIQFGYLVLIEGEPTVHRDGKIQVIQNGALLYETHTTASAHDYDGLNTFYVTFTQPGPYEVVAEVPVDGETRRANFSGTVYPAPEDAVDARVDIGFVPGMGCSTDFEVSMLGPDGAVLNHTDVMVEFRRGPSQVLEFRTHVHTHDEPMRFTYAPQDRGNAAGVEYTVNVVGYQAFPTKSGVKFDSVTASTTMTVPPASCNGSPIPASSVTAVPEDSGGGAYELFASYDPEPQVFKYGNIRLSGIVLDSEQRTPVAHVDFTARLENADGGVVFESESLHEYDGVYELAFAPLHSGDYVLHLTAERGEWKQTKEMPFRVDEAGLPLAAGPGIVTVDGLDAALEAWQPQAVQLSMQTLAGTPIMHSEIDFQVRQGSVEGPLILQNKLHTHSDGVMGFDLALPDAGEYVLVLDPETLEGEPVTSYGIGSPEAGRVMAFTVGPGAAPEVPDLDPFGSDGSDPVLDGDADVPSPGIAALLVAGLVTVALAGRRQ